jgi:hypothetical protein
VSSVVNGLAFAVQKHNTDDAEFFVPPVAPAAKEAAEKAIYFVIPNEVRNLSWV